MAARDTINARIPEWKLQEAVCSELESRLRDGAVFAYAAGLEGVPLTPKKRAEMRRQGMQAGEPDLRFYLPGGRMILIELKGAGGTLNPAQKARHALFRSLGFTVYVVRETTPTAMCASVWAIVGAALG